MSCENNFSLIAYKTLIKFHFFSVNQPLKPCLSKKRMWKHNKGVMSLKRFFFQLGKLYLRLCMQNTHLPLLRLENLTRVHIKLHYLNEVSLLGKETGQCQL